MNKNIDEQYIDLLKDILENGVKKGDRTGTGTISVFGRQIRHKMSEGFPLLTTKKMPFKTITTELLWFLRGDTNIKYLVDNDCHIWNGDAYKNYQNKASKEDFLKDGVLRYDDFINKIKTDDEFAKKWGELGPIYGKQWRKWKISERKLKWVQLSEEQKLTVNKETLENTHPDVAFFVEERGIDQIANLIHDLKTNPDSRRLMVTAWNVGEIDQMTLPPCHYGFQVYTRELSLEERSFIAGSNHNEVSQNIKMFTGVDEDHTLHKHLDDVNIPTRAISLMWNQRSCDSFLGIPFNIASYGLLLEIIAKAVNMVPDELIGNLGDTHLYSNHIEQAKEQIGSEFTEEEIQEHLMQSGMDALMDKPRMEYISKLPKRTREPYPLPKLVFSKSNEFFRELGCDLSLLSHLDTSDFMVENYQSHPTIKAPLSN